MRADGHRARPADHDRATVAVLARGDQVLVQVGTGQAVSLPVELASDLLGALRSEFDQAACAMLDTLHTPCGRRAARPNGEGGGW